jgi:tRNA(fMet)-specific endonuclease VapC
MNTVLLDTNAYTALLTGDERVLDAVAGAERVLMSAIVLGELCAGFEGGSRRAENHALLREFLGQAAARTVDVTRSTAEVFGVVKAQLKRAGTPIPINDVWIAAHAFETGAWVVTYDRHFLAVPGLLVWNRLDEG